MDRSVATLGTSASPVLYRGAVTALDGATLRARCHGDERRRARPLDGSEHQPVLCTVTGSLLPAELHKRAKDDVEPPERRPGATRTLHCRDGAAQDPARHADRRFHVQVATFGWRPLGCASLISRWSERVYAATAGRALPPPRRCVRLPAAAGRASLSST